MAHFFGSVSGKAKTTATRLGHKSSGLSTVAASWSGCVSVYLYYSEKRDRDEVHIMLEPWHGAGVTVSLYSGPVGEFSVDGLGPSVVESLKAQGVKI